MCDQTTALASLTELTTHRFESKLRWNRLDVFIRPFAAGVSPQPITELQNGHRVPKVGHLLLTTTPDSGE